MYSLSKNSRWADMLEMCRQMLSWKSSQVCDRSHLMQLAAGGLPRRRRKYRNHENRLKIINVKHEIIHYKNFLGRIATGYLCNYCYLNHYLNHLKVFRQNGTIVHFVRRNGIRRNGYKLSTFHNSLTPNDMYTSLQTSILNCFFKNEIIFSISCSTYKYNYFGEVGLWKRHLDYLAIAASILLYLIPILERYQQ